MTSWCRFDNLYCYCRRDCVSVRERCLNSIKNPQRSKDKKINDPKNESYNHQHSESYNKSKVNEIIDIFYHNK